MDAIAKNTTWIILGKVLQAALSLVITMMTARFLGPSNYGIISYAASLVAFSVPIVQLGLGNILVQSFITEPEKEGTILGTAISLSMLSSVACIVGIGTFAFVANKNELQTVLVCVLYSGMLVFQALDLVEYWFQAKLISKYVALVSFVAYIIMSTYKAILLITSVRIWWFALSNVIDYSIISISLLFIYKRLGGKKLHFSPEIASNLFRKSKYYIVANMMISIFSQTDKIMLKLMIDEVATGLYTAALSCATMSSFIFLAITDSARPAILESKRNMPERFAENIKYLYAVILILCGVQCIFLTVFAPLVIGVIYGQTYLKAVSTLKILVWFPVFSYLGIVRNIWILANEKQKYLWVVNVFGAVINIGLNLLLIPRLGINGAAIATVVTQFLTNVIMSYLLIPFRESIILLIQSVSPMYLKRAINNFLVLRR